MHMRFRFHTVELAMQFQEIMGGVLWVKEKQVEKFVAEEMVNLVEHECDLFADRTQEMIITTKWKEE